VPYKEEVAGFRKGLRFKDSHDI